MNTNKKACVRLFIDDKQAFSTAGLTRLELATSGLTGRFSSLYCETYRKL